MLKNYNRNFLFIPVLCLILLIGYGNLSYSEIQDNIIIYPPNEILFNNLTYDDLAKLHWEQRVNLPAINHSASMSFVPPKCYVEEYSDYFKLASFYTENIKYRNPTYECTFDSKPIIISLLFTGCAQAEVKEWLSINDTKLLEEKLETCIHFQNKHAKIKATINGEEINNIYDWQVTSNDFFQLNVTEQSNVFNMPVGTSPAMYDGVILGILLPPGQHIFEYSIVQKLPETEAPRDPGYIGHITYKLNITK